jgi:PAS domain S-box-containing protein
MRPTDAHRGVGGGGITSPTTLRTFVFIGFGLLLAVLLVGAALGIVNAARSTVNERSVADSYEVIGELQGLLSAFKDAETGQRGYLLTEDPNYLKPYEDALRSITLRLAMLKALTSDNQIQQDRLAALEPKVTARLDELRQTIALVRAGRRADALNIVRANSGKAMMDGLRTRLADMRQTEEDRLRRRGEEFRASSRAMVVSILLPAAIGIVLLCVVSYLNHRNLVARQNAADFIAEHRERLRTTLASIGDAVISTDTDVRVTNMNAVAESLTGWKVEEAIGQPLDTVFRIVNEETRQPVDDPATKAMKEGVIVGLANQTVLIAKDGAELPIDDSAAPIRCSLGKVVGCVLVFRDVTVRRRAERVSRSLAAIIESSDDAIIGKDIDGVITSWNGAAERLFGYSAAEAIGKPIGILAPADRLDETPAILACLKRGERIEHFDTVRRAKDGRLVPISLTVSPIKDQEGRIVGASKIARDISERLRAEESLREERARLRATLNGIGDAVIVTDAQGRVTMMNPVAEALTGWAEEAIGRTLGEVFHIINEQSRQPAESPVDRVIREGTIVGLANHTLLIAKNGTMVPIDDSAAPVRDSQGQIIACVLVFRDITVRRETARQLADEKARAQSIVNHAIDGIIAMDDRGTVEAVNPAAEKLFGYQAAEVIGQNVKMLMPEPYHSEHDRYIANYLRTEQAKIIGIGREVEGRRKDGGTFPMDLAVSEFWLNNQRYFTGIVRDISVRKETEATIKALIAQQAADFESLMRLQELSTRMIGAGDFSRLLEEILNAAIGITNADMGNIQLVEAGALKIVAQRGFDARFRDFFSAVHDGRSACGAAMQDGRRVIVEDVLTSPIFAGTSALEIMLAGNVRAVQSTPLVSRSGRVLGVFSTHFRKPQRQNERELHMLDLLARIAADLIEHMQTEDKLRRQAALIQTVNDNTSELIFMKDREGRLTYVNAATLRAIGVTAEQALGSVDRENFTHPEEHDAIAANDRQVAQTGQSLTTEEVYTCADGRQRVFLSTKSPVRDEQNEIVGVIGVSLDITERKELEREREQQAAELALALVRRTEEARRAEKAEQLLREADRRKNEFLATLAHELRNPLAPLRNALELIRRSHDDNTVVEQSRSIMERQVSQMVRLVDDLLDISRITQGKLQLRKERVELVDVLNSAVETAHPLIESSGHSLTLSLPSQPVHVSADATRLAQVFANLLNNAAKYTEKGGQIWLTAGQRDGEAVVSVRDSGIGIPADHLPHIFTIFSQVGSALERSQGGLGVGLSLVKGLVELHRGTVEARSDGPGMGSEFTVQLPTVSAPAVESRKPGSDGEKVDGVPKCRILIVDDLRDAADSLAKILRMMGHDIRTAYDGLEAVQTAAAFRPNVVLLDIGLPKINGYEAARQIRNELSGSNVALVALTGWGQEDDKRRSAEAGFNHHLTKPVDTTALQNLLARITAQD